MPKNDTLQMTFRVKDDGTVVIKNASRKMREELKKTASTAKSASTSMATGFKKVAGAIAAVTTALAAMKIASFAKDLIKTGDEIAKMSKRIGVSVEYLSKMKVAAEKGGSSLQKVAMAMTVMTRNLSSALISKTSQQALALEKMGLSAKELIKMKPEQALQAIAKAALEIHNPIERANVLLQLMGRSGTEMIPFLEDLANGLKNVRGELTTEQSAVYEKFNDTMRDLKTELMRMANTVLPKLLEKLTPVIEQFTIWIQNEENLNKLVKTIERLGKGLLILTGIGLAKWLYGVAAAIKALTIAAAGSFIVKYLFMGEVPAGGVSSLKFFQRLLVLLKSIAVAAGRFVIQFNPLGVIITGVATATWGLTRAAEALTKQYKELQGGVEDLTDAMAVMFAVEGGGTAPEAADMIRKARQGGLRRGTDYFDETDKRKRGKLDYITLSHPGAAAPPKKPWKSLKAQTILPNYLMQNVKQYKPELTDLEKAEQEAARYTEEFNKTLEQQTRLEAALTPEIRTATISRMEDTKRIREASEASKKHMESLKQWMEIAQNVGDVVGDNLSNAMGDFVLGIKSAKDAFRDMALSIINDITRMMIKMVIMKAIGSVSGGGLLGAIFSADGNVLKGGFQAFAGGGVVNKPTLGLVGEGKYNEAVVPLPDGRSIPVQMKGGGNPININVNVDGSQSGTPAENERFGKEIGKQIRQVIRDVIKDETRNRGIISQYTYSRAF